MRKLHVLILLTSSFISFSQTERLYYFVEKDSLLGVKNQNEKIIVPAQPSMKADSSINGEEIKSIIFMIDFMKYYDRNGNFLFTPYGTGEGPDYFQEGFIRYSENKKVGLYNELGEKVIPAKYDWMSQINFGFAQFCKGCYFDRSKKDDEHPPLVGGTWGFVGKNGIEILPTDKRNHPKDFETEKHQFIPYQFEYNEKEKEILNFFEKRKKEIAQITGYDCDEKIIYYEIIGKPTIFDPFYKISTFELCDDYIRASDSYNDFKTFKVSADGKNFYTAYMEFVEHKKNSEYVERKIPVDKWIKQNLKMKK